VQYRTRLRQSVRACLANRLALARQALLQSHNFGVQVVRHRDGEEKQHERQADRAPFAEGMPMGAPALVNPTCAPSPQDPAGNQRPQNIEKGFHIHLHDHWRKLRYHWSSLATTVQRADSFDVVAIWASFLRHYEPPSGPERAGAAVLPNSSEKRWRRGWDSNPRLSFPNTRFRGELFRPLRHLSAS
jgi:hypothetical protein